MANPFEMVPADPVGSLEEHRQQIAKTASLGARASSDRAEVQSQSSFRDALRQISPGLPVMEQLGQIASAAVTNGRFSEAEKAIQVMSTLDNRDSMQEQRVARIAQATAGAAKTRSERMLSLYAGVTDAEGKALADNAYALEFGVPSPWAQQPYSPAMVKLARESQVKQLDETTRALREAQILHAAADDARKAENGKAYRAYYEGRVREIDSRNKQREKSLGKVAEVSRGNERHVEAKLLNAYPDLEPAEFDLAVREIAADAKDLQLREHGSYADAVDKVLETRKGQFTRLPGMSFLGMTFGKGKDKYTSTKPLTSRALPLPESSDPEDLEEGQIYRNSAGKLKKWIGTGWEDVDE